MSTSYIIAETVEVLNLVMRKVFAQEILNGRKKVEFRAYSQHYLNRLYDKKVLDYMHLHRGEQDIIDECDPLRPVKKLHFHNYENTWFLDVECTLNDIIAVTDEDVKYLQEEYGCHELDEQLTQLNATKAENRPMYFYFVIGDVIDTNLR